MDNESIAYILTRIAGPPTAKGRLASVAILVTHVGVFLRFVTEFVTP